MLIELSIGWVIALNVIAWLVIQFALAWSFTQLAPERFDYRNPIAVPRGWERSGKYYKRVFAINRWKHKLPDASRLFRIGFAKGNLNNDILALRYNRARFERWIAKRHGTTALPGFSPTTAGH